MIFLMKLISTLLGFLVLATPAFANFLGENDNSRKNSLTEERTIFTNKIKAKENNSAASVLLSSETNENERDLLRKKSMEPMASEKERAEALYGLGDAYFNLMEYKNARDAYEQALNINRDHIQNRALTLINIGETYFYLKEYKTAKSYYQLFQKYFPGYTHTFFTLARTGEINELFGDRAAAENNYEEVIKSTEGFTKLLARLGMVRLKLKENTFREENLISFKHFMEKYNKNTSTEIIINDEILFKLGNLYKDIRRYEDAISAYKKLAQDFPVSRMLKENQEALKESLAALIKNYYEKEKYLGVVGLYRADRDLFNNDMGLEKIVNASYKNLGIVSDVAVPASLPTVSPVKYIPKSDKEPVSVNIPESKEGKLSLSVIKPEPVSEPAINKGVSRSLSLMVNAPPEIVTNKLMTATAGVKYFFKLEVKGGTGPYVWSIAEGNLPDGLSLDNKTGVISGIPTGEGVRNFVIKVEDANMAVALK